jgi:hypothetical protein
MALLTVAQVNAALRLDLQGAPSFSTDERTPDVELKIKQAEDIVLDFVQPKPNPAWTAQTVPGRVTAAMIMIIQFLIDDTPEGREAIAGLSGLANPNNNPIAALLWRLRDPSLA